MSETAFCLSLAVFVHLPKDLEAFECTLNEALVRDNPERVVLPFIQPRQCITREGKPAIVISRLAGEYHTETKVVTYYLFPFVVP